MAWSRFLIIVVSAVLILGLLLWLSNSLLGLYSSIYWISPWLANLLLGGLLLLLLGLVAALVYYAYLFLRPQRRRQTPPRVPIKKTEAAEETLQAIRQQVEQIQDEVARQALLDRSRLIEESLSRRELRIVVFGTGSAGKTSLVNAIVGRVVGQVGAAMGTTAFGETYRLQLRGLDREIYITDTPGILEAGIVGTEREQTARQLATEADLLLFVVDNDLRQSEYAALQQLANIGKRSLLVFNKTDLYTDIDRATVLAQLQQKVHSFIQLSDVIPTAANPQPIRLEDGSQVQPDVDILLLLQRMATVLRSEGEDLVADNILLQSQQLGEEARRILDVQRRQQAESIVDRYQWIGAGVIAVTPLPGFDLLATAAINAQMVVELGRVYGCEINISRGKELAISLAKTLVSLGVVRGAIELFSVALQTNAGTFLIGRAVQGATAAYLTRIAGKSFIEYFRQNQDWGDGGITEVVEQQFRLNQRDEFIRAFVQDAIARVVQPLRHQMETHPQSEDQR